MRSYSFALACLACINPCSSEPKPAKATNVHGLRRAWGFSQADSRVHDGAGTNPQKFLAMILLRATQPIISGSQPSARNVFALASQRRAPHRQKYLNVFMRAHDTSRRRMIVNRRRAIVAALVFCRAGESRAALYCIPGVTEKRCRGTFWETGQFYKKETNKLTPQEYDIARNRLKELMVDVNALQGLVDDGLPGQVGEKAVQYRIELRKLGERLCASLQEDQQFDSREQLLKALSILDELDVATLQAARPDNPEAALPPSFTQVDSLLKDIVKALATFLEKLPNEPTA